MQERAFEESQKYKEGKYILEKAKLMKAGHRGLRRMQFLSHPPSGCSSSGMCFRRSVMPNV